MLFYIVFMFIFSKSRSRIRWRPVIWGFTMQFIFGLAILRWQRGARAFQQASNYIVAFLEFTNYGTKFVYGFLAAPPNFCGMEAVFAFAFLPVIIYFGAVVAVLFYFGVIQAVLKWMAWFMQITLGESTPSASPITVIIILQAPQLQNP